MFVPDKGGYFFERKQILELQDGNYTAEYVTIMGVSCVTVWVGALGIMQLANYMKEKKVEDEAVQEPECAD